MRLLLHLATLFFFVSLLPACSLQPVVVADYPPGVCAVEGQYIWDSWIVEDEGTLHRYALSAPTEGYGPNDRHQHAFVRHAISKDGGKSWEDLGPAIEPQPEGTWPDHVIWTSSVMLRKDAAFRGYVGKNVDGPWELIYNDTDRVYGHKIYAPTLFEKTHGSGDYAAVTFFSEDTGCPITGTPVVDIDRDAEDLPRFDFDKGLGPCLIQGATSREVRQ
ncbi:MAG: hypothetical protein PVI97_14590 [Candidatus Thiodiazotropha sp.]|jgi:hypothetical protein